MVDGSSLKGSPSVGMNPSRALKWQNYGVLGSTQACVGCEQRLGDSEAFSSGVCGSSKGWG